MRSRFTGTDLMEEDEGAMHPGPPIFRAHRTKLLRTLCRLRVRTPSELHKRADLHVEAKLH